MRTDCTYYCVDVSSEDLMKKNTHLCTFSQKRHITATPLQSDYQYDYSISGSFSFNGKEKDWESGFHYYGARYYWSEVLTGWLSVDPMADKYPSISPYAYCNWNPVKLVDPEGEEAMDNDDEWKYNTTTKKIEWLNGNGGSTHQTVTLTSGDGNHESFNSMVSYNGVIEDMFDFNVFSNQTDNIVDGGANILGGVTTCVGGVALAVATEGAATNIAVPIAMTGGAQVGFGIESIANSGSRDPKTRNEKIVSILKAISSDAATTTAAAITKKVSPEKVILTTSKLTKFITGYAAFALDATWSAVKYRALTHPTMKGIPDGSIVTHNEQRNRGVGLIGK